MHKKIRKSGIKMNERAINYDNCILNTNFLFFLGSSRLNLIKNTNFKI